MKLRPESLNAAAIAMLIVKITDFMQPLKNLIRRFSGKYRYISVYKFGPDNF